MSFMTKGKSRIVEFTYSKIDSDLFEVFIVSVQVHHIIPFLSNSWLGFVKLFIIATSPFPFSTS